MNGPAGKQDPGTDDLVLLGTIAGAHGIGGEVRVFPYNDESENLASAERVRVRGTDGVVRAMDVARSRRHKKFFLMKLDGIDDHNAAEASKGCDVLLPRAELADLGDGEFYVLDLVGAAVTTDEGRALGSVVEVFEAGAAPVVVVRAEGSKGEHMIAFSEDAVVEVAIDDPAAKRLVVRARAVVSG